MHCVSAVVSITIDPVEFTVSEESTTLAFTLEKNGTAVRNVSVIVTSVSNSSTGVCRTMS